jgi:polyisoprenoid-binding protein YceI
MRTLKNLVFASALLAVVPAFGQTSTWTIDPAHSTAEFAVRHLGVSNVHGRLHNVTGTVVWNEKDITKSHVEAVIDTTTVDTSEPKRDAHLKSPTFFDVEKYPTMKFVSTQIKRNGEGKLQIVGNLTLGGQTKPVTLDGEGPAAPQPGMGGKTVSGFSATGTISRKEFNFGQDPKFQPPVIGDEIKLTIDVEIDK